jgi:hypothetical protein
MAMTQRSIKPYLIQLFFSLINNSALSIDKTFLLKQSYKLFLLFSQEI